MTIGSSSRRGFFSHFVVETSAAVEELGGRPQLRMAELRALPADVVDGIRPLLNAEFGCFVHDRELYVAVPGAEKRWRCVRRLTEAEASIVNCFDGTRTLSEIACLLSVGGVRSPAGEQLSVVREIFFALAELALCHPADDALAETRFR